MVFVVIGRIERETHFITEHAEIRDLLGSFENAAFVVIQFRINEWTRMSADINAAWKNRNEIIGKIKS
jgi:hypothetical protein